MSAAAYIIWAGVVVQLVLAWWAARMRRQALHAFAQARAVIDEAERRRKSIEDLWKARMSTARAWLAALHEESDA